VREIFLSLGVVLENTGFTKKFGNKVDADNNPITLRQYLLL
jgi:hypothetical protein